MATCSRWLTYPFDIARYGLTGISTIVSWSPAFGHRSSLDGAPAAALADGYRRATGRPWAQPLGLAHALLEVAARAVTTADDPKDRWAVAAALRTTKLSTMAGRIDWTTGPAPGVAAIPLAGGRWMPGDPPELAVVTQPPAAR